MLYLLCSSGGRQSADWVAHVFFYGRRVLLRLQTFTGYFSPQKAWLYNRGGCVRLSDLSGLFGNWVPPAIYLTCLIVKTTTGVKLFAWTLVEKDVKKKDGNTTSKTNGPFQTGMFWTGTALVPVYSNCVSAPTHGTLMLTLSSTHSLYNFILIPFHNCDLAHHQHLVSNDLSAK